MSNSPPETFSTLMSEFRRPNDFMFEACLCLCNIANHLLLTSQSLHHFLDSATAPLVDLRLVTRLKKS